MPVSATLWLATLTPAAWRFSQQAFRAIIRALPLLPDGRATTKVALRGA